MLILLIFVVIPWLLLAGFAILTSMVPLLVLFAFLVHMAITVGTVRGLLKVARDHD